MNLKGNIQGQSIFNNPQIQGHLQAGSFNLKALLESFGKKVPTQDASALQRVSGAIDFQATNHSLNANPLNLVLDDSTVRGNVSIENFTPMAAQFNLAINQINLDRYLPVTSEQRSTPQVQNNPGTSNSPASLTKAGVATSGHSSFPQDANIRGDIRVGSLTLAKTVFSNVEALLGIAQGQIQISPLKAGVFQGTTQGMVKIDLRSAIPVFSIADSLSNIQLNQLTKSNRLTGTANVTVHVTMQGKGKAELLKTLNGNTQFEIKNGVLMGVNIPDQINRILAMVKRQPAPAATGGNQTEFGQFTGSGLFTNGVFNNNDLLIQSSQFKITGRGTANLITEALDYHLQAVGLHSVSNAEGGTSLEEQRTPIPLLVTGTFSKPIVTPDPEAIAGLLLQQKVEKLKEQINERTSETVGPIRERAKELLRQRFGQ